MIKRSWSQTIHSERDLCLLSMLDDVILVIPLRHQQAMANRCLNSGELRFVATLTSKLLRSPSSRLQATRNASYSILRATNTARNRREINHIASDGPAFQFSSLGCCLGCGVRGRIKSPITVPGITGRVLRERERESLISIVLQASCGGRSEKISLFTPKQRKILLVRKANHCYWRLDTVEISYAAC